MNAAAEKMQMNRFFLLINAEIRFSIRHPFPRARKTACLFGFNFRIYRKLY